MNDYDYLIEQLGLLIGFLDVSNEEVYDLIKHHDQYNLGFTIAQLYNNRYIDFQNHICSSALLLGFSHMEDFISKCIVKFLIAYPHKNTYKVTITTIKEKGEGLINHLAEEKTRQLTFTQKIDFIGKDIGIVNSEIMSELRFVNDIRNCLMHNNGIADVRIASRYIQGEKITLSSEDVNSFGIKARVFAKELWEKTNNLN